MRRVLLVPLIASSVLCTTVVLAADVYRWVDKDGVIHYGDKAPSPDVKPAQLPKLERLDSSQAAVSEAPAGPVGDRPASRGAAETSYAPKITSPVADDTLRDAERHVTVNVSPNPPAGWLLIYYLDGNAVNASPTPSSAYLLNGVERGEHTVAVAAVSPDGRIGARSPNVRFFMQPPIVRR